MVAAGLVSLVRQPLNYRRISSDILEMAQYFLTIEFDKYIVLDQDLLPFPIRIFTGVAFLYQYIYLDRRD